MKHIIRLLFVIIPLAGVYSQGLDDSGSIRIYPDQPVQSEPDIFVQYGVHGDLMPGSQPGIFLGAQGGINWASGFHLGLRASFLVNKGIQSVVYPFYSYGYGLAVLGGGYRLPLGGDFTALTRFSLGLGGWGVSSTDTNQSGGTLQGSALMVPELLLEYYGWPVLSVGLSIRYHFFLSSPSLPGTDLGDVQGLSVGVELNLRS